MADETTLEEPTILDDGAGGALADDIVAAAMSQAQTAPQRQMAAPAPKRPEANGGPSLDFILDLPLEVSVELGRARMLVGELLQLGQGAVVELNKLAGEPLEVLVNQKLVARGEAVVVGEKFGIRITDVVPADERARRLG
jgi:flagellar motor switch protein FliN/FliY